MSKRPRAKPREWTEAALSHVVERANQLDQKVVALESKVTSLESQLKQATTKWWMSWLEPAKPHAWKIATASLGMLSYRLSTGQWPSVPDFAAFLRMLILPG